MWPETSGGQKAEFPRGGEHRGASVLRSTREKDPREGAAKFSSCRLAP